MLRVITSGFNVSKAFVRPGLLVAPLIILVPVYLILTRSWLNASGNTITVNNITDSVSTSGSGFCTLREAIDNANNPGTDTTGKDCAVGTGTDTINFSISGTISLRRTLPAIVNTLTIDGSGETVTANGGGVYQVLVVKSGAALTLNNLTIENGGSVSGGGVYNGGRLTVTNTVFSGNGASNGGGIFNAGPWVSVTNSTFVGNSATSGGGSVRNFVFEPVVPD